MVGSQRTPVMSGRRRYDYNRVYQASPIRSVVRAVAREAAAAIGGHGTPVQQGVRVAMRVARQLYGGRARVQTPGGNSMTVKRGGALSSKSAGFIYAKKKLYKKKKGRKGKSKKPSTLKFVKNGVERTAEGFKQISTTSQVLDIGHATFVRDQFLDMAWKAVLKKVFRKMNINTFEWTDTVPTVNSTSYQMLVRWVRHGARDQAALPLSAGATYQALVDWLKDPLRNFYLGESQVYLEDIIFQGAATQPAYKESLRAMKVHFQVKSTLKIQNRCINSAGGEQDSVDNVPLYGKVYEGPGTGLIRPKPYSSAGVISASMITGFFNPADILLEPIDARHYSGVKHAGKVKLDPGEIKTSSLTFNGSMFLSYLCRISSQGKDEVLPYYNYVGKFKFMALEKMIDTIAYNPPSTDNLGITVGVELNTRYRFLATNSNYGTQQPEFARGAL